MSAQESGAAKVAPFPSPELNALRALMESQLRQHLGELVDAVVDIYETAHADPSTDARTMLNALVYRERRYVEQFVKTATSEAIAFAQRRQRVDGPKMLVGIDGESIVVILPTANAIACMDPEDAYRFAHSLDRMTDRFLSPVRKVQIRDLEYAKISGVPNRTSLEKQP